MNTIELIKDAVLLLMIAILSIIIFYSGPSEALELNVGTGQRVTNDKIFSVGEERRTFDFVAEVILPVTKNTEVMITHTSELAGFDEDYGFNMAAFNAVYRLQLLELKGGIGVVDTMNTWNQDGRENPVLNFSIGAPATPETYWRWSWVQSKKITKQGTKFHTILFSVMYRIGE